MGSETSQLFKRIGSAIAMPVIAGAQLVSGNLEGAAGTAKGITHLFDDFDEGSNIPTEGPNGEPLATYLSHAAAAATDELKRRITAMEPMLQDYMDAYNTWEDGTRTRMLQQGIKTFDRRMYRRQLSPQARDWSDAAYERVAKFDTIFGKAVFDPWVTPDGWTRFRMGPTVGNIDYGHDFKNVMWVADLVARKQIPPLADPAVLAHQLYPWFEYIPPAQRAIRM